MMKKLLSLALTLAMLCCMATTASAVTTDVVGTHTAGQNHKGTVEDGVTEALFASSNPSYKLDISVSSGEVQHRYAVDITFDNMEMSITAGNLVWNVNTLKYESVANDTVALEDQSFEVVITNYSDLPIYLNAAVTDNYDGLEGREEDGITISTDLAANTEVGDATAGTAVSKNFNVNVASTGWDAVANFYLPKVANGAVTVGTVQITVAKSAS